MSCLSCASHNQVKLHLKRRRKELWTTYGPVVNHVASLRDESIHS